MKLLEVLQGLDYEVLKGNTDTEIREIQNDSRKVQLGDLFSVSLVRYQMDIHMQRMWLRRVQP